MRLDPKKEDQNITNNIAATRTIYHYFFRLNRLGCPSANWGGRGWCGWGVGLEFLHATGPSGTTLYIS